MQRSSLQPLAVTGFEPQLATQIDEVVEHFNGNHADTVLFMARFAAGVEGAWDAEISGVDVRGVDVAVRGASKGVTSVRLDFAGPVRSTEALQIEMFGWLGKARERAGADVALTSIEQEMAQRARLQTFVTAVVRTKELTPHIREITFAGGLDGFVSLGVDQFLYVIAPREGDEARITNDFTLAQMRALPEAERPGAAYYTVRRWRADAQELDMWFLVHGDAGIVARWASRARPGDRVAMWGPRKAFDPPAGTTELLLVGDETALPAIAAILDEWPSGQRALVILEVEDTGDAQLLEARDGVTVRACLRRMNGSGELLQAVREVCRTPGEGLYAFGAAESMQIAAVRRYLRREFAMAADRVQMTGYWRRGRQKKE